MKENSFRASPIEDSEKVHPTAESDEKNSVVLRRREFVGLDGTFDVDLAKIDLLGTRPLSTSVTSIEGYLSMTRPKNIAVEKLLKSSCSLNLKDIK